MTDKPKHIVLLIHGMRTQASWAEMVAHVLEADPQIKVQPIKYGFFDIFRFLFPFWTREKPIRRIIREYRDIRQKNPNAKISVIAHSFGTYALVKALREPDLEFYRIIFCGSIVPDSFRVASHRAQIEFDPILNDCGSHDVWPLLARSVTWGYGSTGTFGFGTSGVRDRFNKFSHSEYFSAEFVREFWQPYISNGEIVPTDWESSRDTVPFWQSLLSIFPLKWIAIAIIAFLGFWGWQIIQPSTRAELAYPLSITHLSGAAYMQAAVSFNNIEGTSAVFSGFHGELISPNDDKFSINFDKIFEGDGIPRDITEVSIPSNSNQPYKMSFIGNRSEQLRVLTKIDNYLWENPVDMQAWDIRNSVIPDDLAEELANITKAEFPWVPGEWEFVFEYTVNDETKSASIVFNVSENVVSQIGSAIPYYNTGMGILTSGNLQFLGPNGNSTVVEISH